MAKYTYNNESISEEYVIEAAQESSLDVMDYIETKEGLEIIEEEEETTEAIVVDCDPGYEKNSEGECVEITETVSDTPNYDVMVAKMNSDGSLKEEEKIPTDYGKLASDIANLSKKISKEELERRKEKVAKRLAGTDANDEDFNLDSVLELGLKRNIEPPDDTWKNGNNSLDDLGVSVWAGGTGFERRQLFNKAQSFADKTGTILAEDPTDYERGFVSIADMMFNNNTYDSTESSFDTVDREDMNMLTRFGYNKKGRGKKEDLIKQYPIDSPTPGLVFDFSLDGADFGESNIKTIPIQQKREEFINGIKLNLINQASAGDSPPDWKTDIDAYIAFKKKLIYEPLTTVVNPLAEKIIKEGAQFYGPVDKKIVELNKELANATGLRKNILQGELDVLKEKNKRGGKLYDARNGKLYNWDKASESVVQINEGGDELAKTTELDDLKTMVVDSYYDVVATAKTMVEYIDSLDDYNTDKLQVFKLATGGLGVAKFLNVIGDNTTVEDAYNVVKNIAETGKITKDLTKFPGDHPIATRLNESIIQYLTINRAIGTNTSVLTSPKETASTIFKQSLYDNVKNRLTPYDKVPWMDNLYDISPKQSIEVMKEVFNTGGFKLSDTPSTNLSLDKTSTGGRVSPLYNERMKETFGQFIGTFPDLVFFVGELAFIGGPIKKLNLVKRGGQWVNQGTKSVFKAFSKTPAARSSEIAMETGKILGAVTTEASIFSAHTAVWNPNPTFADFRQSASFGGVLGGSMQTGQWIVNRFPIKWMSLFMKNLSQYKTLQNQGGKIVGAYGVGAPAFEIASAIHDWEGYKDKSWGDITSHMIAEGSKLYALSNRTIFWNMGAVRVLHDDLRKMSGKASVKITNMAKTHGVDVKTLENPTIITQQELRIKEAEEINKYVKDPKMVDGEQFDKVVGEIAADFNEMNALIELNIFKAKQKIDDNTGVTKKMFPSAADTYVITEKLKRAARFPEQEEELTAEENQMLSNIPNSVLMERLGLDTNAVSGLGVEYIKDKSQWIEYQLDGSVDYHAPDGSTLRESMFKHLSKTIQVETQVGLINKKLKAKSISPEAKIKLEEELKLKEAELKNLKSGAGFERTQEERNKFFESKEDQARKDWNEILKDREYEIKEIEDVESFQAKYDEIVGDGEKVGSDYGFTDPNTGIAYVNVEVGKLRKNLSTTIRHEGPHIMLKNSLKGEDGLVSEEGIEIIDDMLSKLSKEQKELVDDEIDDRYRYRDGGAEKGKAEYYEEYITVIGELIHDNKIFFTKEMGKSLIDFIPFLSPKVVKERELNADSGENLFELIKEISTPLDETGKISEEGKQGARDMITKGEESPVAQTGKQTKGVMSKAKVDDLAVQYKADPKNLDNKEIKDLKTQYTKLSIAALKDWAAKKNVPIGNILSNPERFKDIESDILNQFESVMKNYKRKNPVTGKYQTLSTYIGNIVGRRVGPKLVEEYSKRLKKSELTPALENIIESDETADQVFTNQERAVIEGKGVKLIDIRENPNVEKVLTELEKIIKVGKDDTSASIIKNNKIPFASKIYDIPKEKLEDNKNLTYDKTGTVSSETSKIQRDFNNKAEAEKSIKLLPPFTVIGKDVVVTKQGESVRVPGNIKGTAVGVSNKVADFFYEPFIDSRAGLKEGDYFEGKGSMKDENGRPTLSKKEAFDLRKLAETNPSGRSTGKSSQTYVRKLKPEFTINKAGKLNPAGVAAARTEFAGIDFDFSKLKGKELTRAHRNLSTKLKSWAITYAGQVALSVADKGLSPTTSKEGRAIVRAGRSRVMFSAVKKEKEKIFKKANQEQLKPGEPTVKAIYNFAFSDIVAKEFPLPILLKIFTAQTLADAGLRVEVYKDGDIVPNKGAAGTNRSFIWSLEKLIEKYGDSKNPDDLLMVENAKALVGTGEIGIGKDLVEKLKTDVDTSKNNDSPEDIAAMKLAMMPQNSKKISKNKKDLLILEKGKELILQKLKNIYDKDNSLLPVIDYIMYAVNANYHPFRNLAIMKGGIKDGYEEHMLQYGAFTNTVLKAITSKKTDFDGFIKWANRMYYQESITAAETGESKNGKVKDILDQAKRLSTGKYLDPSTGKYPTLLDWESQNQMHPLMEAQVNEALEGKRNWEDVVDGDIRKYNEYQSIYGEINSNRQERFRADGKTIIDAKFWNVEIPKILWDNKNAIYFQNELIVEQLTKKITSKEAQDIINEYVKLIPGKTIAASKGNLKLPKLTHFSKAPSNKKILEQMDKTDKAFKNARNPEAPTKGISVWDFDDTLATTKSNVLYELPNGKTGKLSATEFAKRVGELEDKGAIFDFSEFNEITKGKKGPMFQKAVDRNKKFGNNNVFILTARPNTAAKPIHDFLKALGLDIPLKNIIGLEDGLPSAKARWVVEKASEGYNDFYFADDAYKNVKAVQDALSVLDVKSKSRQAFVKFSKAKELDKRFNDIIANKTGIGSEKEYSRAKAEVVGASKGKFKIFIPSSAEDFLGLLYPTLGKGKTGDDQVAWYKKHLLDPYARGSRNISTARVTIMNDYRALKKELKTNTKDLLKKIPGEPFTKEQAIRVYIWNKQGMDIPGLSKTDNKELVKYVEKDAKLKVLADQIIEIGKGGEYAKPKDSWLAGGITTDILQTLDTTTRVKYLEEWQRNSDVIFSEKNLNKLEAAYGKSYREALENMLERMKTGRNRNFSGDTITGRATDWLTGSIGAIMFFNTRSAVLQTISAANYVNFTDNNILQVGKAFANQPQYWKDFIELFNSDFLVDRRRGLRLNVNESDIARAAKKDGVRGVISKLLEVGFLPTQIADSFAIAAGGSTFYRNRIKTYEKKGFSPKEAIAKAKLDWIEISQENQQSSRADKISQQQAGSLGRIVLAFANTPIQYTRLMKKAMWDLKDGRGDAKTNISKIIYYGLVQNFIFNALQQALFAISMGDDEPEIKDKKKEEKYINIANSMSDTILRGTGIYGSIASVVKNAVIKMAQGGKAQDAAEELLKVSPPVSSKYKKIRSAGKAWDWDKEEIINGGWSLENPAWLAGGNVVSATTNIPLDRVIKKVTNINYALSRDLEEWERLALIGGWQDWEIGLTEDQEKFLGGFKKSSFKKSSFKKSSFKKSTFK